VEKAEKVGRRPPISLGASSMSTNEIATKQKQVKPSDLRNFGWLQTRFPESFGSGGISGPEIGDDGHLWIKIPISDRAAATALKGAGFQKSIQELFPDAEPGKWQLSNAEAFEECLLHIDEVG